MQQLRLLQAGLFLADTRRSILAPTAIPTCASNPHQGLQKPSRASPSLFHWFTAVPGKHSQEQECIFQALGTGVGWGHPSEPFVTPGHSGTGWGELLCCLCQAQLQCCKPDPAGEHPREPSAVSEALVEWNKTQSSPAGWTVSHAEPWGPVLPCSGCLPGCSGVCWCLLPVLLRLGGLHVQEDGLWSRDTSEGAASQSSIPNTSQAAGGHGEPGHTCVCSEAVPGQPGLQPAPRAEGSTAKPPWMLERLP